MIRSATLVLTALCVVIQTTAPAQPPAIGEWDGKTESAILEGPYEDPLQQEVAFGRRSFYLSPWRSYMDTWSAERYLDCLGFNWNGSEAEAPAAFRIMADAGFRHVRIEIGWGEVDFDRPDQLSAQAASRCSDALRAARLAGLRPIILLNGHHGHPCPLRQVNVQVLADAPKESREVALSKVEGIKIGYTGINTPAQYKNPAMFITNVDAQTKVCLLSKPLPTDLKSGQTIGLVTLRFQPFAGATFKDGRENPAAQETLNGWIDYVKAVGRLAKDALGTHGESDAGFDLEVWNEYTFGSNFLDIKHYYDPAPEFREPIRYSGHGLSREGHEIILPMTVDYVSNAANELPGVRVISGFANQRPWENGRDMWPDQAGFSRHYYTGVNFKPITPENAPYPNSGPLNAMGSADGTPAGKDWHTVIPGTFFVPTLFVRLPEFWHYGYQTEFITRDIQPFPGPWPGHHRFSNPGTGRRAEVWMTEYNFDRWPWSQQLAKAHELKEDDPALNRLMDHIATKVMLRATVFHSHKGIQTVAYFAAKEKVLSLGLIAPRFYAQLKKDRYELTDDARKLAGAQVAAVGRVARLMKQGKPLSVTRALSLERLVEHRPRLVFAGNGTPEHPDRFNRDDLACLPFQLDADRYAVGYYVVTRDVMHSWNPDKDELDPARYDMPDQTFDITLGNIRGHKAKVSAWDPQTDQTVPVTVLEGGGTTLTIRVAACDYPRFLLIQESASGPLILTPKLQQLDQEAARLTFQTNVPADAKVTWGPIPRRVRSGTRALPKGQSADVVIPRLAAEEGVRVEMELDGLRCVWPRWGHDVQGVLQWSVPGKPTAPAAASGPRWPAIPQVPRPTSFKSELPDGLAWQGPSGQRSLTLGQGDQQVEVKLTHRDDLQPEAALPELSTLDRVQITAITWSAMPAWRVQLKMEAVAHPGLKQTAQECWIAPQRSGLLVLQCSGTEQAISAHRKTIDAIAAGIRFDADRSSVP